MKSKSFAGMACSIAGTLEILGDRWSILVLRDLSLGLCRYDELLRSTGMPTTTLAGRLKHLESKGLIERVQYQDNPPRSEYRSTAKGKDAWIVLFALAQLGDRWDSSGAGAPPVRFVHRETGRRVKLALVDAQTGEAVQPHRVMARAGAGADDVVHWRLARKQNREAVQ